MPYKNKYGTKLYKACCTICGFETITTMAVIKRAKQCSHLNSAGKYIDFKTKSESKDRSLVNILKGMRRRCYNKNSKEYKWYGGKGITICTEWIESFSSFIEWAWQNGYQEGLSIDRINPDGPYSPENCRWVTIKNNAKYKSSTKLHTIKDITMTGREWADYLGIGTNMINKYLRKYGEKETYGFIEYILDHPEIVGKAKSRTSYYSIYQEAIS